MSAETTERAVARLASLHAEIDEAAQALAHTHVDRLVCRLGCASCCTDDITVFAVEAERIRRAHPDLLADEEPHAEGACAFLGEGDACRVYANRPYVCRTQGLPLRWFDEMADGEVVERRDICPLNDEGDSLLEIEAADCWTLGPTEDALRRIAADFDETLARVRLRDLFDPAGRSPRQR